MAVTQNQYLHTGWLGRVLDATCNERLCTTSFAVEVDDSLSLALKGETISGFAVRGSQNTQKNRVNPFIDELAEGYTGEGDIHDQVVYLHSTQ